MAKLKKELGLKDVVAICTGSMFSSGFFLLPGIAASEAGPAVFLSYFLAAILIMPAIFSMAELATAIPRAGGDYYFIDRSLGPLAGTLGGVGTYFALVLKTAFALVGIGAYVEIFYDIPIKLTALSFTGVFMVMNILGAKKASGVQKIFVLVLILVLLFFLLEGMREIFFSQSSGSYRQNYTPFLPHGFEGMISTAGLVFVSYLGLTKIASMSEEIKKPEKNIPLGMGISLIITTIIYVAGVFIIVGVLPADELWGDLAPVSSAAERVFSLIPPRAGALMIMAAAVAAFASTGNAGLMTASRYPLAMARDKKFPSTFAILSRFRTPLLPIIVTTAIIAVIILSVSEKEIARLASSFQLIIFMLINLAVIVMRNSRIETYDPGYLSPLYPWMQIFGIISCIVLFTFLGWGAVLFSLGIVAIALIWYWKYVRKQVIPGGAIYHWFAHLGKNQRKELEGEFFHILKDKGLREGYPFDEMIVKAKITRLGDKNVPFEQLVRDVVKQFEEDLDIRFDKDALTTEFINVTSIDPAQIIPGVSVLYGKVDNIECPSLHIVLSDKGIKEPVVKGEVEYENHINVMFFLVSKSDYPRQQLRLLSRLMDVVERKKFVEKISSLKNDREIKEYLLHNERYISMHLTEGAPQGELIGKKVKKIRFTHGVLLALVQRKEQIFCPDGETVLQKDDIVTFIGKPEGISTLFNKYIHREPDQ